MKKVQVLLAIASGSLAILGSGNLTPPLLAQTSVPAQNAEMRHYKSGEWNFALDVPKSWNRFPPVSSNSPYEVTRFASQENGRHLLIVFRSPNAPNGQLKAHVDGAQQNLAKGGFSNFVQAETKIGSKVVMTLDFDKVLDGDGRPWYCRQYFIVDGTLLYVLGFGTTDRDGMFPLYDRMAKTFTAND